MKLIVQERHDFVKPIEIEASVHHAAEAVTCRIHPYTLLCSDTRNRAAVSRQSMLQNYKHTQLYENVDMVQYMSKVIYDIRMHPETTMLSLGLVHAKSIFLLVLFVTADVQSGDLVREFISNVSRHFLVLATVGKEGRRRDRLSLDLLWL